MSKITTKNPKPSRAPVSKPAPKQRGFLVPVLCEVGFGVDDFSEQDARAVLMEMLGDKFSGGVVMIKTKGGEVELPIRLKVSK